MVTGTTRWRIWVIHGPNLNLLGGREPEVYGRTTLTEIDVELSARGEARGVAVECFQSNVEGEIVSRIQAAGEVADGIIINPAAYTHTSVAIRDALAAVALPAVEVHLSNLHRREAFRRESMTAPACIGQICGFGAASYYVAFDALLTILAERQSQ